MDSAERKKKKKKKNTKYTKPCLYEDFDDSSSFQSVMEKAKYYALNTVELKRYRQYCPWQKKENLRRIWVHQLLS